MGNLIKFSSPRMLSNYLALEPNTLARELPFGELSATALYRKLGRFDHIVPVRRVFALLLEL